MMSMGAEVAVTASLHNGSAWQPLPQLLSLNASLLLIASAIKFRASVPDCNRALSSLEYRSAAPVNPSVHDIAHITIIVNDMGNYGCYNDCSTAEPVPLLAVSTIVIINYGWFTQKWLLLRPGVLLGVATGIGMLLIVMASVCAWLYLVNRLLLARGTAQKVISSFGVADEVLLKGEGQQAQNATENDDEYTRDEVQANQHLEYAATLDTYAKDGALEDGGAADLHVDCCSQDMSAPSSASNAISGDGMHDCAQVDVVSAANEALDVISRDGIHDYTQVDVASDGASDVISGDGMHDCAQADFVSCEKEALDLIIRVGIHGHVQSDYSAGAALQCSQFSRKPIHSPDSASDVQATDLLENDCPASDTIPAIHVLDSSDDVLRTGGQFQSINTVDHELDNCLFPGNLEADGCSFSGDGESAIAEEGLLEGIGRHDLDGYTLACHLEGPDQKILPTDCTDEPENTSMTNRKDGIPFLWPCKLDDRMDRKGMQHLGCSMVSRDPLKEEERSRSLFVDRENLMSASLSASLVDNSSNQQNVEDDQACNDRESQRYENTLDDLSSAVKAGAADGSQKEYPNELDNEGAVSSMPFGYSSSGSQSSTTIEGNANLERTMSIGPMLGMHSELEEDWMCALNTDTSDSPLNSFPGELFDEEMSQMPDLKLVLELPEASTLDEDMDPLDHINLVFSSLEIDADGSLVAVLSQSFS